MDNKIMAEYVGFIADRLPSTMEATAYKTITTTPGSTYRIPYKALSIPTKLRVVERLTRSIIIEVEAFEEKRECIVYLSRIKGPEILFGEVRSKVDEVVNGIAKDKNIDLEKLDDQYGVGRIKRAIAANYERNVKSLKG